ncbi:MAG: hypothetical protein U5K36_05600 [Roseovarius sp.]|nr:hypothetical protein [Roseovarius sp.]
MRGCRARRHGRFRGQHIPGNDIATEIGTGNAGQLRAMPLEPSSPKLLSPWFMGFSGPDGGRIELDACRTATNRPDSLLGLHYPASDIPDPARRHFLLNVVRSIPDINSARVPILDHGRGIANCGMRKSPRSHLFQAARG